MSELNWVAYDGEGLLHFRTEKEAIDHAQQGLDYYREQAPDGWFEEVEGIFVAKVVREIVEIERREVEEGDLCYGCDYFVDYELVDAAEAESQKPAGGES